MADKSFDDPKLVTVLGSTGSIGCSTLDLISRQPSAYQVQALTGNQNVEQLIVQARKHRPILAVIADDQYYTLLKDGLSGTGVRVASGREALVEAAALQTSWVMAGIVGMAGLEPTLAAAEQGVTVALANKECLVCSGDLLLDTVQANGSTLLPVDSEHNAIFQVFDFDAAEKVQYIILTASGGPFRETSINDMRDATPEQAVAHPNWEMGAKISVDSATMMNKGLELIEAYYLFPVNEAQIEILVHPQSVVHSMVEYIDGSVLAQMGTQDMRMPISYALGWPDRMPTPSKRLNLAEIGELTFEVPDFKRFPALRIARDALKCGGGTPTILNAANEVAVENFLSHKVGFLDIAKIVEDTVEIATSREVTSLDDVNELDAEARELASAAAG